MHRKLGRLEQGLLWQQTWQRIQEIDVSRALCLKAERNKRFCMTLPVQRVTDHWFLVILKLHEARK